MCREKLNGPSGMEECSNVFVYLNDWDKCHYNKKSVSCDHQVKIKKIKGGRHLPWTNLTHYKPIMLINYINTNQI